ncbi:MAG: carboxypeptidase regulatory-like domain-containing protein [Cytophagaceae bacterium]|nr:carboxypeptidase regulatory-like domain-containing protein [Cytophagaceae bacterium]
MIPRFNKTVLLSSLTIFILSVIGMSVASNYRASFSSNLSVLPKILAALNVMQEKFPEERVYLHLDKPFYKPGEAIWFKAYLRNGTDFRASSVSDILHVEFIDPKGNIAKHIKLISKKGFASGDFQLEQEAAGGLYKIKAYTNWQKNESNAAIFEKEIQVQAVVLPKLKMKLDFDRKAFGKGDNVSATVKMQTLENKPLANTPYKFIVKLDGENYMEEKGTTNEQGDAFIKFNLPQALATNDGLLNILISYEGSNESISRSIPIVLNTIDFKMYPEGGDLVTGLESKVAFKALNEFGKPADVEGIVENSKGEKVADLKSFHFGMGAFTITPEKDEKYVVKITNPKDIAQTYEVPEALERGYSLSVSEINKDEITLNVASSEYENLSVVCSVRDQVYYSNTVKATYGSNKLKINTSLFPIGVARITLFDSRGIERAERLAFVNKHKQLKVKIETDKEKYQPREKVKMTLKITDEKGLPMPANFSLSVADDNLLSFADDRSGNILSKMLLEYEVKDKIEEPAFYFNAKEEKADAALDYLLMTSGWRRFTWKQILEAEYPEVSYAPEKTIISGKILDPYGNPLPKAKVEVVGKNIYTNTSEDGTFALTNVELYQQTLIKVSASGYNDQQLYVQDYNSNTNLYLYKHQTVRYHSNTRYKHKTAVPHFRDGGGRADIVEKRAMKKADVDAMEIENEDMLVPMAMPEPAGKVNNAVADNKAIELNRKELPKDKMEMKVALDEEVEFAKEVIADDRIMGEVATVAYVPQVNYYRAREFSAPVYNGDSPIEIRNDFRSTIYWNGNIETDRAGKAVVEFYNSDAISSFKAIAEGISVDGMLGRAEQVFFTQLPFSMSVKSPVEVSTGDFVSLPLTLKNNTEKIINGDLNITLPEGIELLKQVAVNQTINPKEAKLVFVDCKVNNKIGKGNLTVAFKSAGFNDAFSQELNITAKGFPAAVAFSGNELEKEFMVNISNMVPGSLEASLTAYPSVVNDMMKGVESIVREPYGCFEQTSSSNYPNIMVKQYLMEYQKGQGGQSKTGSDFGIKSDIDGMLDRGYKRLVSYKTSDGGYEWFGASPGHEALTAYGLVQFNDMKKVYDGVDEGMMKRTADWLLSRRDGKGGFEKNPRALDNFGRASQEITNAYITYSLAEAGFKNIAREADLAYETAMTSKDPYQLALAANTMFSLNDITRGEKALSALEKLQDDNGSWNGKTHSITWSQGTSLMIEATSLSVMAMLKSKNPNGRSMNKAVGYILSARSGYGSFGSTQGTILALKAITQHARFSKRTAEDGMIELYIDGHKVISREYKAGETKAIEMKQLEKFLSEGKHKIKVKYPGVKEALPYSFAINYNTFLPANAQECKVTLKTKILNSTVKAGETVRMNVILSNTSKEGLPMTMAVIGIPAGMTAQPWQLKEIQEKKMVDFYEIRGNYVFFYYRQMAPNEIREINLDLKAEMPGEFEANASSAYLYYTNEFKHWSKPDKVKITK